MSFFIPEPRELINLGAEHVAASGPGWERCSKRQQVGPRDIALVWLSDVGRERFTFIAPPLSSSSCSASCKICSGSTRPCLRGINGSCTSSPRFDQPILLRGEDDSCVSGQQPRY